MQIHTYRENNIYSLSFWTNGVSFLKYYDTVGVAVTQIYVRDTVTVLTNLLVSGRQASIGKTVYWAKVVFCFLRTFVVDPGTHLTTFPGCIHHCWLCRHVREANALPSSPVPGVFPPSVPAPVQPRHEICETPYSFPRLGTLRPGILWQLQLFCFRFVGGRK